MNHSILHRFQGVHKKAQRIRRPEIKNYADQLCQHHPRENAESRPFLGPCMLSRSQILADKGGKHHRHTHDRQKYKTLDLCIGAVSGNRVGAESVDITLDHNIAHTDHRILDARRQSLADHLSHHVSVKMQLSKIQAGRLIRLPAHPDQTQYHTEPLGKHCG